MKQGKALIVEDGQVPLDLALVTTKARKRGKPYVGRDFKNSEAGSRLYRALRGAGYDTLAEVARGSRVETRAIRCIGKGAMDYLGRLMQKYGFEFEISDEEVRARARRR